MNGSPDIVIIGSGMGGATLAAALAPRGMSIIILERGERLADTPECRDDRAIFADGYFRPDENWLNGDGEAFNPGNYYYVGGNSKFYGAVLMRFRAEDFDELQHQGGVSPAWPLTYAAFEPWYQAAEEMYQVRGDVGQDPTEPVHSGTYPFSPVPDEPSIAALRKRLEKAGVTPSSLPLAVDVSRWLARGQTPWDAFPDTNSGKNDAESIGLAKALAFGSVSLITGAEVTRLAANDNGRIVSIDYSKNGARFHVSPKTVVLSAGAVNSAALLLGSANETYPRGLANGSDMVGRHFMNHNCSALLAVHPFRRNDAVYQKTIQFNDFYLTGGPQDSPLGNIQLLGKISGNILASQSPLPRIAANWVARHSVDWYAMSEDLPNPESRVTLKDGRIVLDWKRSNWAAHTALVRKASRILKTAGYPIVLSRPFDRKTPSHQCGTARFGNDPKTSVLDSYCRSHDHENLFVVDASFMPTSAAVNPALTIAAQAMRVAKHMIEKDFAA
jgi:choline dehydrogenase-like flavoprotein